MFKFNVVDISSESCFISSFLLQQFIPKVHSIIFFLDRQQAMVGMQMQMPTPSQM